MELCFPNPVQFFLETMYFTLDIPKIFVMCHRPMSQMNCDVLNLIVRLLKRQLTKPLWISNTYLNCMIILFLLLPHQTSSTCLIFMLLRAIGWPRSFAGWCFSKLWDYTWIDHEHRGSHKCLEKIRRGNSKVRF